MSLKLNYIKMGVCKGINRRGGASYTTRYNQRGSSQTAPAKIPRFQNGPFPLSEPEKARWRATAPVAMMTASVSTTVLFSETMLKGLQ